MCSTHVEEGGTFIQGPLRGVGGDGSGESPYFAARALEKRMKVGNVITSEVTDHQVIAHLNGV